MEGNLGAWEVIRIRVLPKRHSFGFWFHGLSLQWLSDIHHVLLWQPLDLCDAKALNVYGVSKAAMKFATVGMISAWIADV
ncbi:hypothetical protein MKX08_001284 [Trichoderma sp. CBMAI-0020]|nr:hypothetical protein MKX08_001284 [Trichoderma sp. CBMAI-0020]